MKTFRGDFEMFKDKLIKGENFAFLRFSDGEFFILQNRRLELNENNHIIGNVVGGGWYNKEEQKKFDPNEHQFYRQKLIDSLKFKKHNYYKGICCRCCVVKEEDFDFQVNLSGGDESDLTWANLFINGNYEVYIKEMVPIFKDKKIIMIVNESANISNLPFDVIKDFRVGTNCFINDYDLIEKVKNYISENNIENHIFLISAASLSNLLVHQLYDLTDKNTYMDIGSTLNPIMDMVGWKGSRSYLREYWLGENKNILNKICVW